jgi:hypothetical protein
MIIIDVGDRPCTAISMIGWEPTVLNCFKDPIFIILQQEELTC